ncbi:MAG: molybdopterin converting factor subunit 1 [Bacteroidota bacterium]
MNVRIKLFSLARDLAGFSEQMVDLGRDPRAGAVLEYLSQRNPEFADWRSSIRIAVNQEYVSIEHALNEGDEVAVIPPVSGG